MVSAARSLLVKHSTFAYQHKRQRCYLAIRHLAFLLHAFGIPSVTRRGRAEPRAGRLEADRARAGGGHHAAQPLADVLLAAPQVLILADDIYKALRYDGAPFATLAQPADFLPQWLATLTKCHDRVIALVNEVAGLSAATPLAAFYVFVTCGGLLDQKTPAGAMLPDAAVADYLLTQAHVATLPGSAFGAPGFCGLLTRRTTPCCSPPVRALPAPIGNYVDVSPFDMTFLFLP